MRPVSVQVITYAPTVFRHCQHCEVTFQEMGIGERIQRSEARDALPDELMAEYQLVSDWVHELIQRHRGRLAISVIDAASLEGFFRSIRHGVRRYPAVIVDGHEKRQGTDLAALDPVIDRLVADRSGGASSGKGAA